MDGVQNQLPITLQKEPEAVDLLVIGGGINGAGIARDAAGRGLTVVLCEKGDLGGATSSASSKLIHGGLRYLEQYEFGLVRKALKEREVLMRAAPHLVTPMSFVLPQSPERMPGRRPGWMVRLGLFIYDYLGGARSLPGSGGVDLRRHPAGEVMKEDIEDGFSYADCWGDDARLVVANAQDAAEREADIFTHTEVVSARRDGTLWAVEVQDRRDGAARTIWTKALVNAAGPWAFGVLTDRTGGTTDKRLRLVKGSHIVVPRLMASDHACLLQNDDGRVIFVIPFQERFSLIGTTEADLDTMPETVAITDDEIAYLCAAVGRYFANPPAPEDVVWSYAGVRPLFDDHDADASAVTRGYVLELDAPKGAAPLLSVLGGKLTTYRVLAEEVMDTLARFTGKPDAWTASAPLPGGNMPGADFYRFQADVRREYPWLDRALLRRLVRTYGTRVEVLLGDVQGQNGLGQHYGDGIYEAELHYVEQNEWVESVEDFLWRRTKLGLIVSPQTEAALAARWDGRRPGAALP